MRKIVVGFMILFVCSAFGQQTAEHYLDSVKAELQTKWPKNRTINLVFHGHSVPTGYLTGGVVTLESYPFLTLKKVKDIYPYAVVNCIVTSIGGEESDQGSLRFSETVLNHDPDVLFIDYGLNDRRIGLEKTEKAWKKMIEEALDFGTKVVLLTPTPDLGEDIMDSNSPLAKHSASIRKLAEKYDIGLIDSYRVFQELAGESNLENYMAQNNHVNELGHEIVANEIIKFFFQK